MKRQHILTAVLLGFLVSVFILFSMTYCYAQFYPFFGPYFTTSPLGLNMFYPSYDFFPPLFSPMSFLGAQIANPIMSPLTARPPFISRSAATTIVILPQATTTPVTAYAPLGTLTLTPSTLVFLILLFTLHE